MAERKPTGEIARRAAPTNQRGFALVLVLWAVVLLALIATAFATTTRTGTTVVRNTVDNAVARALADAGVVYAVLTQLDAERFAEWAPDGKRRRLELRTGTVDITIQDEAGKIDLNAETTPLMNQLFVSLGVDRAKAAELADAIADFRDADDQTRPYGAEADAYRAEGLGRLPRNRPFDAVQELMEVMGMNGELYARIAPFVTVHSGAGTINPLRAPRAVLMAATGGDPEIVDAVIALREEAPHAAERRIFDKLVAFAAQMSFADAGLVTILAEGNSSAGGRFIREAVVDLTGSAADGAPYRIVFWSQRFD